MSGVEVQLCRSFVKRDRFWSRFSLGSFISAKNVKFCIFQKPIESFAQFRTCWSLLARHLGKSSLGSLFYFFRCQVFGMGSQGPIVAEGIFNRSDVMLTDYLF